MRVGPQITDADLWETPGIDLSAAQQFAERNAMAEAAQAAAFEQARAQTQRDTMEMGVAAGRGVRAIAEYARPGVGAELKRWASDGIGGLFGAKPTPAPSPWSLPAPGSLDAAKRAVPYALGKTPAAPPLTTPVQAGTGPSLGAMRYGGATDAAPAAGAAYTPGATTAAAAAPATSSAATDAVTAAATGTEVATESSSLLGSASTALGAIGGAAAIGYGGYALTQGRPTLPAGRAGTTQRVVGGIGAVAGGVGGAKLGAAVGTAIAPGVGTVIGGVAGGVLGAAGGALQLFGKKRKKKDSYYDWHWY
jgi:hypothetical protein